MKRNCMNPSLTDGSLMKMKMMKMTKVMKMSQSVREQREKRQKREKKKKKAVRQTGSSVCVEKHFIIKPERQFYFENLTLSKLIMKRKISAPASCLNVSIKSTFQNKLMSRLYFS